ncbi:cysteine-rich venom protein [Stegastes partitus]|uniref:Cysteine-rich venom protein n=2 Tax=Stegastes partitus TaxID=144197 RepID=A0A9Y4JQK4_9TELE|nr:PREDICTED: cysteine-rich venom protein-like [Stegastes partitus]
MLGILICILAVHQVHAACNLQDICPNNTAAQSDIVNTHNGFRRAVQPTASNMLRMNYSEEVAASAQAWIDKCELAHGAPSTRMLNGYELGENLFYSSALTSWTDVIQAWHNEVSHYTYPTGSSNGETVGHYTQVVWNSSYKVGCGATLCPNGIYFYGCHYYRAGNFEPYEPYKAGPSCGSCPDACDDKLCTNPCPYINKYINCPAMKNTTGCSNKYVAAWCPASCKCTTEIIPIY